MTTPSASPVTLDEQIEYCEYESRTADSHLWGGNRRQHDAILTSLRELKRIKKARDVEPVAWRAKHETKDYYAGAQLSKPDIAEQGWQYEPLYSPEVLDLLAAEKLKLAKVMEALLEVCYLPGSGQFSHINYCRWCHYAEGHPHGDGCLLSELTKDKNSI